MWLLNGHRTLVPAGISLAYVFGSVGCGDPGTDDDNNTPTAADSPTSEPSDTLEVTATPSTLEASITPDGNAQTSPPSTPTAVPSPTPSPTATPTAITTIVTGNVSGLWCGLYHVTTNVTVSLESTLEVCAGSTVSFDAGVGMRVEGTIELNGTLDRRISLQSGSESRWAGLSVTGILRGEFVDITLATLGINGLTGSDLMLEDSSITASSYTLQAANGGSFDRSQFIGGQTIYIAGGLTSMVDSFVDLQHPEAAPDCLDISGGGLSLDHVHITGCHCPLHITKSTSPIVVTNSILDGAVDAIMIAKSVATLTHNHLIGRDSGVMDIGEQAGGIQADVAGNYWGGGAPIIMTPYADQFTGSEDYSTLPFEDVGPR